MEARVIKFRAWDTYNERMVDEPYRFYPSGEHEKSEDDKRFDAPFQYYGDWTDEQDGVNRPCHIMQHTGLIDKNQNGIWEGDIVKCHDHPTGVWDTTGYVYYEHGRFMAYGSIIQLGDFGTAWTEVIGNIYQNPELLK